MRSGGGGGENGSAPALPHRRVADDSHGPADLLLLAEIKDLTKENELLREVLGSKEGGIALVSPRIGHRTPHIPTLPASTLTAAQRQEVADMLKRAENRHKAELKERDTFIAEAQDR